MDEHIKCEAQPDIDDDFYTVPIPSRQEIVVLSADEVKPLKLEFVMKEKIGIGVFSRRAMAVVGGPKPVRTTIVK